MVSISTEIDLELIACSECGITYGLPARFTEQRRGDHKSFYCPNGHNQHFPGQTRAEKLAHDLKQTQRLLREREQELVHANDQRQTTEQILKQTKRSLAGTQAAYTRLKNRVANGVCPCCQRSFQNLHDHMQSEHPGYVEQENDI